jgi:beta-galactosidase
MKSVLRESFHELGFKVTMSVYFDKAALVGVCFHMPWMNCRTVLIRRLEPGSMAVAKLRSAEMTLDRRLFLSGVGASLGVLAVPRALRACMIGLPDATGHTTELLFGADYYPDQTPEELWTEDARKMAAMGLTVVRVAEFAWGLMEPSEGKFDFSWLHRSVDVLHKAGISVILGTPSAAPPPWLTAKYPEVMEVNAAGVLLSPGTRRFTCPTNQRYRELSLVVSTAMAKSFAETPGVIGWQIDNELTLGESQRCYCRFCKAGFQGWLKARYGSLDALNAAWGTVFWSQTYTAFNQIPVPLPSGGPPNPGLALDYDRYQSAANVGFLKTQLPMLRKECPRHFVTTNNVTGVDVIVQEDLYADLDFVATDNYPGFIAIYAAQSDNSAGFSNEQISSVVSWSLDMTRGAKQGKPFLVMEQQAGKAGQNIFSPQPEKGQLRLWAYQTVAHGAMGVNFFRWDTATFGAEEYWHGLLNHDRSESAGFAEIAKTIQELKALGADALHADYMADAALIFDYSSDWALAIQPGQPKLKYQTEVLAWYGVAAAGGALVDVVDGVRDLSKYKVVFAPSLYVLSEAQA